MIAVFPFWIAKVRNGDYLSTAASLWRITMDEKTLIEPVLIEEVHPSPLYEDILQTGIAA